MPLQWRTVGNTVSDLTGLRFESQTFCSRDERITARPTSMYQAEIIIAIKVSYPRKSIVTMVQVKLRSCNQDCGKNDAFAFTKALPTIVVVLVVVLNYT